MKNRFTRKTASRENRNREGEEERQDLLDEDDFVVLVDTVLVDPVRVESEILAKAQRNVLEPKDGKKEG
jgi:hypothetical protein